MVAGGIVLLLVCAFGLLLWNAAHHRNSDFFEIFLLTTVAAFVVTAIVWRVLRGWIERKAGKLAYFGGGLALLLVLNAGSLALTGGI